MFHYDFRVSKTSTVVVHGTDRGDWTLVGHSSYARSIFLRATKKKEFGMEEMGERTLTQEGRNLSPELERNRMKGKLRVLCSLSSEKGEKKGTHTAPLPKSFHNGTCEVLHLELPNLNPLAPDRNH
jgi:hypothetical protein